jgi:hypothetical protein
MLKKAIYLSSIIFVVTILGCYEKVMYSLQNEESIFNSLTAKSYKKYEMKWHDFIYILGWSKNGRLAFIREKYSPAVPRKLYSLIIQDMVTDSVVYRGIEWSAWQEEQKGNLPDIGIIDTGSVEYYFKYNYENIEKVLLGNQIVGGINQVIALPYSNNKEIVSCIIEYSIIKKDDGGRYPILQDLYVKLIVSKNSKLKEIMNNKMENAFLFDLEPIGYIKNPFENRIAIVLALYAWGIESDNCVRYQLIGCDIENGFK